MDPIIVLDIKGYSIYDIEISNIFDIVIPTIITSDIKIENIDNSVDSQVKLTTIGVVCPFIKTKIKR
jgi:hypothetical protein